MQVGAERRHPVPFHDNQISRRNDLQNIQQMLALRQHLTAVQTVGAGLLAKDEVYLIDLSHAIASKRLLQDQCIS